MKNPSSPSKKAVPEPIKLVPGAQVIITGKTVNLELATAVIEFIKEHSITNWCHTDGAIGHLDSVKTTTTFEKMCGEFHLVAAQFPSLELAITFMDNVAGSYNKPIVSYVMRDGRIRRDNTGTAHFGFPPPRRAPETKKDKV